MASSLMSRGFRTFQVFTKNTKIVRTCPLLKNVRCVRLYTNQSSKRFHQASHPTKKAAMIGIFGAAGVAMLSNEKKDIKAEILELIERGKSFNIIGDNRSNRIFESAKDEAKKALRRGKISEEERDILVVIASKLLGEHFLANGYIDKAEECFMEALESYKKLGFDKYDDPSLELILRLTNCFALNGREVEAKESFDMIIDTQLRKIKDSETTCPLSTYQILWATLQLYGRFLILNKDYDEAERLFYIADDVMQKASGEMFSGRQDILTDLAGVKIVKQDLAGAEATFEKAIKIGEKGNSPELCLTYCYMADLATRMGNLDKAEKMCTNGLRLAEKLKDSTCLNKANLYIGKLQEARTNKTKSMTQEDKSD
ncbi:tetratricopeptide repeat protein 19, mitochondrial-like [Mizuhopecten yessoensis]|uniref:Tetratricopeptide repeat protein 19, mitochondrial n=1 Tax=Mizuhopecten yessoensis TaxID=6573 RepID=A0A210QQ74_MIZYE|nr:tetratricopeptide repeat protein 19, mitochondrial-like [Mizuhopecten yessoensis]OWF50869.1 Tetratricopeptide repeat protein 19, mitochondrial [Mizuhopecten yessoensis]